MVKPAIATPAATNPFFPLPFLVISRRRETRDTVTLRLRPLSDVRLIAQPGQFMMLSVYGVGEVPISVSGLPRRPGELEHTIRAVGSVTRHLVALHPGDQIGVRGPFGTSWPLQLAHGQDVLLIAGGLGFAPLRSALLAILRERWRYRQVIVLYGARSPADLLYRRDLSRWLQRPDLVLRITVDHPDQYWRGQVGVVPNLIRQVAAFFEPANTVAMICGPEIMMRFTIRELQKHGIPDERIFLSLERNMQCAIGLCGHCQLGPFFLCKDGPVLPYSRLAPFSEIREF